jgi:hypothetical protein
MGAESVVRLARTYADASPFPHIVMDDFFPADRLKRVTAELRAARIDPEAPGYGFMGKRRCSDPDKFPPEARRLIDDLTAPPFLRWLEELTGIADLQNDPFFEGGGLHQIPPGGYLKIHTDFNWHKRLGLHRRINLLLYLNEGWNEDWGGHLELWDEAAIGDPHASAAVSIAPLFNRVVIFSTTDTSYHGHPVPLACPPDRTRNSIALYYYTKERPSGETRFFHSNIANYRPRPGEDFGRQHRINQIEIRSTAGRAIIRGWRNVRAALGRVKRALLH